MRTVEDRRDDGDAPEAGADDDDRGRRRARGAERDDGVDARVRIRAGTGGFRATRGIGEVRASHETAFDASVDRGEVRGEEREDRERGDERASGARGHEEAFARAADGMFHLHQQLEWAKAPLWDLPGALDVLCNGTYGGLPREISEIGARPEASAEEGEAPAESEEEREARLDVEERYEEEMTERLVRSKTFGCEVRDDHLEWPSEKFKVFAVEGGKTTVGVEGEYRATLTLGGPVAPDAEEQPRYGGWRVESIELLAGDLDGKFELNKAEARKLADMRARAWSACYPSVKSRRRTHLRSTEAHQGLHSIASDAVLMKCATAILTQAGVLKDITERAASRQALVSQLAQG